MLEQNRRSWWLVVGRATTKNKDLPSILNSLFKRQDTHETVVATAILDANTLSLFQLDAVVVEPKRETYRPPWQGGRGRW